MKAIPLTPRAHKIVALATQFAEGSSHSYVGTEHLLLGILSHSDGVSATIFEKCGINRQELFEKAMQSATDIWASARKLQNKPDLKSIASKLQAIAEEILASETT